MPGFSFGVSDSIHLELREPFFFLFLFCLFLYINRPLH
jgi:hypothetical protein